MTICRVAIEFMDFSGIESLETQTALFMRMKLRFTKIFRETLESVSKVADNYLRRHKSEQIRA